LTRAARSNAVRATSERRRESATSSNIATRSSAPANAGPIARATGIGTGAMLSLFVACGSSESGLPIPVDDLARVMADAVCHNIGPCCQQGGFLHDPAQCHAAVLSQATSGIDELKARPNVAYDGAAARACVDVYTSVVKACSDGGEIEPICSQIFVGTLQSEQTCIDNADCAPGLECGSPGGPRQCTPNFSKVHGKLGDECYMTCTIEDRIVSHCGAGGQGAPGNHSAVSCFTNEGLYCDSARVCSTTPAIGQPCTGVIPCAPDAFCEADVCTAKRTSGSCGQTHNGCAATTYCDFNTFQCRPRKSTGAACTTNNECLATDVCEGTCRTRTIASTEVCMGNL
jgi:hypothetical protein